MKTKNMKYRIEENIILLEEKKLCGDVMQQILKEATEKNRKINHLNYLMGKHPEYTNTLNSVKKIYTEEE